MKQRIIRRAIEGKTSSWLNVLPIAKHHFDLSAGEFRDALAMRYGRSLLSMPSVCDGCGELFTLGHALDCKKGGLVTQRHNEVRDALGDMAALAYRDVVREPIVRESDESRGINALVADLRIRGVWQPQTAALFDIRVVHTDAQSYVGRSVQAVLKSAELEKKRKYNQAAADRHMHASFTPFVLSVDGLLAREADLTLQRFADKLSRKWDKPYAEIMGWMRTRLSFAILRATNYCVRGSRVKWRSGVGMEDGAGLNLMFN